MFVGEIGYDKNEFLYQLKLWELKAILRGYRARSHALWEATRLGSFLVMSAQADLKKAGIRTDRDLLMFGWEDPDEVEAEGQPDEEEVERLRQLMREENERLSEASQ